MVDTMGEFDAIMKMYFHDRAHRVEKENNELWNIAIALVNAIAIYNGDHELKRIGETETKKLRFLLEQKR